MSGMMWLTIALMLLTVLGGVLALIRRVSYMEQQLGNGLSSRLERVEERQHIMLQQVADLHGWMVENR